MAELAVTFSGFVSFEGETKAGLIILLNLFYFY